MPASQLPQMILPSRAGKIGSSVNFSLTIFKALDGWLRSSEKCLCKASSMVALPIQQSALQRWAPPSRVTDHGLTFQGYRLNLSEFVRLCSIIDLGSDVCSHAINFIPINHFIRSLLLVSVDTELGSKRGGYAWLEEKDKPDDFFVVGAKYKGPKIVENWGIFNFINGCLFFSWSHDPLLCFHVNTQRKERKGKLGEGFFFPFIQILLWIGLMEID